MSLPKQWNKQTSAWKNHLLVFNPNIEICKDNKFLGNHHNIDLLQTPAPKFSVVHGPRSKPPQVRGFQDVGGSVELMSIVGGWGGEGSSQSDNLLFFCLGEVTFLGRIFTHEL